MSPTSTINGKRQSNRWNGAHAIPHEAVQELHHFERAPILKYVVWLTMLTASAAGAVATWNLGWYALTLSLWIMAGVLGHVIPLAFHDASHHTLFHNRKLNELFGVIFGTLILVPLNLYRYAHGQHHTYLATEKDPELWPFTDVRTSRLKRILVAAFETIFGIIATPILFARAFATAEKLKFETKLSIWLEYGVIASWVVFLTTAVYRFEIAQPVIVGFIVPWFIAGILQTTNKYVEHMGMMGEGIIASTRTVLPENSLGAWFSSLWHNVAHHGTHHLYARVPYENLPATSDQVIDSDAPDGTIFPSYRAAFYAMIRTLGNPRVGAQWQQVSDEAADV